VVVITSLLGYPRYGKLPFRRFGDGRGHAPAVHLPRLEERTLADVVRIGQRFETYGRAVAPRPGVPTKPPSPARRALRRAVAVVPLDDIR
jgi:hypothetical protein